MQFFFERLSKITRLSRDQLISNISYELTLSIELVENDHPSYSFFTQFKEQP